MNNNQSVLFDEYAEGFALQSETAPDHESIYRQELDRREGKQHAAKHQLDMFGESPAGGRAARLIDGCITGSRINEAACGYGASALSDHELLSLIAGPKALAAFDGWAELTRAPISALEATGLTRRTALILKAITSEIPHRIAAAFDSASTPVIYDNPQVVYDNLSTLCRPLEVEKFWTLCLNRKNRLIRRVEVTSGTATSSLVHPREVFRAAIAAGASAVIAVHNHPSGDPAPSRADIQVTRQLREAAKTIGIDLLDHIIIGNKGNDPANLGYYSFNDAGLC